MTDCKICTGPSIPSNELIRPCKCNSLVHRSCLNEWIKVSVNPSTLHSCEVCLTKYQYEPIINPNLTRAKILMLFLMIRDLTAVLLGLAIATLAAYALTSYLMNTSGEGYSEYGTRELVLAAGTIVLTCFLLFASVLIYLFAFYTLRCCCIRAGMDSWHNREPYVVYLATYESRSLGPPDLECCTSPWLRCWTVNPNLGDCGGDCDEGFLIVLVFCAIFSLFIMAFIILWLTIKIVIVHSMNLHKASLVGVRRIRDTDASINI